jgi:adenosylmethionine-8-amino-7-oxononanoate aminotransferase
MPVVNAIWTPAAGRRFLVWSRPPDVLAAMHRQIDRLAYAHTSFFTSDTVEQLAEQLVRTAPGSLNYAYFVSGGSEAVETALKLARQYFVEIGQPDRTLFIARKQSYHGNTLGALAVGGNEWRRRQFAPLLMDVVRVSACNEYRDREAGESQQQYTERAWRTRSGNSGRRAGKNYRFYRRNGGWRNHRRNAAYAGLSARRSSAV